MSINPANVPPKTPMWEAVSSDGQRTQLVSEKPDCVECQYHIKKQLNGWQCSQEGTQVPGRILPPGFVLECNEIRRVGCGRLWIVDKYGIIVGQAKPEKGE